MPPGATATEPAAVDHARLDDDLSDSPLWNADLAPTPLSRRTWSTYDIAALWIGMSVVITTYTLASGLMAQGMSWSQAMLTILLGNTVVLVPMMLNAHAGTKYGISFPVLCRASFGVRGANVPAMLRAVVACGWFGIQTWIGGLALNSLFAAAWEGWTRLPGSVWIAFGLFWAIEVYFILRGTDGIRLLESFSAPLLLVGGAALLVWAVRSGGGMGPVLAASRRLEGGGTPFWTLFPAALTASVGYWATLSLNIPDFTRYARSQRSQVLGQALGLPTTMTAFAFIGVAVTSATVLIFGEPIWDPVVLITRIGAPAVIIFAALVVLLAQLTTNMAANVVSPANDFSHLSPRRISYVTGGLITAVIGIAMMPWKLYSDAGAYIFTWLIGYSSLMGAIGGILIADYWVLRRQRLSLTDLFRPDGRYAYRNGVNPRAIAALVIAVLPVVPGFIRAATTPGGQPANPGFLDQLYTYAWFVTFAISFGVYLLLMRGRVRGVAVALVAALAWTGCAPAEGAEGVDLSRYRMVDLTHAYNAQTIYWPTSPTSFALDTLSDGPTPGGWYYASNSISTPEHGGTHLDAPRHFAQAGQTSEQIPLERLIAPAVVIDISVAAGADPDYLLSRQDVLDFEERNGQIQPGTIVLLRTGWSRFWPDRKAYLGDDTPGDASKLRFPSYGPDAARLLVEERRVGAIGVDVASIDNGRSTDFQVHRIAGAQNVPGFENLTGLEALPPTGALLIALPMKIEGGSGGPLRVVALVPR